MSFNPDGAPADGGTCYTTKAGNLWVWTLGSTADCWVRQMDRQRAHGVSETNTAALEAHDVEWPVSPFVRLGAALGLKGPLTLVDNGAPHPGRVWRLYDGAVQVREFAASAAAVDADHLTVPQLPLTLIPQLAGCASELVLEVILEAVEAKPADIGEGQRAADERAKLPPPPWEAKLGPGAVFWHRESGGAYREVEVLGRTDKVGWPFIRLRAAAGDVEWHEDSVSPDVLHAWWASRCNAPRHDSVEGYKAAMEKVRPDGGLAARLKAEASRNLMALEVVDHDNGEVLTIADRRDVAAAIEHLTAAWANLTRAGSS